jgi:hypothetical protein
MFNGVKHFLTEKSDSDKEKNKKGLKLFIGEYFKLQFASFFILLSFAVFFLTKLILCAGSDKKEKKHEKKIVFKAFISSNSHKNLGKIKV